MQKVTWIDGEAYTGGELVRGIMALGGVSAPKAYRCLHEFAPDADIDTSHFKKWSAKALLTRSRGHDAKQVWACVITWLRKDKKLRGGTGSRRYYRFLEGNIPIE
jgi:hypothetical protein